MHGLIPRRFAFFLICFSFFLIVFTATYFAQNVPLTLKEKSCRLIFDEDQVKAVLALENTTGKILPAHINIELLDQKDRVRYHVERDELIKSGSSTLAFDCAKIEIKDTAFSDDKLWWRLRYEITPAENAFAPFSGIISASMITPDIFDLQVFAAPFPLTGTKYQVRIRTSHPLTGNPVNSVILLALAKYEQSEKEHTIKATAKTNQDGYAVITFDLPKDLGEDDAHDFSIEFTAKKGSLERTEDIRLQLLQNDFYLVTTDKNLYQPGQTIHTRLLLFDQQKQARADYEMDAKIEDADEQVVFRTKIKTSKFGAASFDWPIPDNVKLGGYKIKIGVEKPYRIDGQTFVKISRYDLPTFAVKTKADKPFYLPNDNAEVEIKADYLFGQPVTKGSVKVVREEERSWNYKTSKYDVIEGETYRGEIDASGKFTAHINLKELHEKFEASDYRKFEDVHFAAYLRDATTGRTESCKFDLRLTKEPIHLYLIQENGYAVNELIAAYINASYADGSPAQCEIEVYQNVYLSEANKEAEPKLLTRVATNKLGLARLSGVQRMKSSGDENANVQLILQARDAQGKTGKIDADINIDNEPTIRVRADKSLYRAGEAINATIKSSAPNTRAVLEVLQNGRVLSSQLVAVREGVARVNIPYKPELKDEVTLVAYANIFDNEQDTVKFVYGSRTILFPQDRELKVAVKMSRNEYQPGEQAQAELLVKTADGKPVNSLLGAMIVDTAVGERERTDNEFRGSRGWNYYGYYYGDANIAGLTRRDFDQLDLKQAIPDGYDLAAEVMLQSSNQNRIENHHSSEYRTDQKQVFNDWFEAQFHGIKRFLESEYTSNAAYPRSFAALKFMLHRIDLDPEELRDPWGTPYKISFDTNRALDEMTIRSAGADKQFDTNDDFTAFNIARLYFKFLGEAINRAVANYQAQAGDYIRDAVTLKNELKREGVDLDALRDPWGTPYQIRLQKSYDQFYLLVSSAGKDKKVEPEKYNSDDFELWRARVSYFAELRYQLDKALAAYEKTTGKFPGDETTFRTALQKANINFDQLRDPLGHGFYAVIAENSYYTTRAETFTYTKFGEKPVDKIAYVPITQTRISINIRGLGEDDKEGTPDDFSVVQIARVIAEQSSQQAVAVQKTQLAKDGKTEEKKISGATLPPGLGGSITGTVTDAQGAVVSNAKITAQNEAHNLTFSATSNGEGIYFLRGLSPDIYKITIAAAGFKRSVFTDIRVTASKATVLDITLQVGTVSETVAITAEVVQVQTESASRAETITVKQVQSLPLKSRDISQLLQLNPGVAQADISTPRLREYFPETLLWQPNIETDKQGRAQLKFKMADNLTTWKLSLIGSTADGQIGTAEQDIRAFQPFFAELDPPKVLTEGDEISLPIVLRNYLDKSQTVDLQFKPENWFTMLSPARKKSEVKPNDSSKEIFTFRAASSIKNGKQRVTAIGSSTSDAIEKSVNVHPDGEELAQTAAGVFSESGTLEINLPNDAIKGSTTAEVKIYPNLLTHVTEGIEGILHRPYGCGEQTISSTYPNVMALRLLKTTGQGEDPRTAAIAKKARKFSQAGYERLLGYRDASGGFTYWGKGEPDLALTAYAVRFLNDASEVVEVNEDFIDEARAWLLKQQSADGHWIVNDYYDKKENARRSLMYTSLIARALSLGKDLSASDKKAITRALDYLTPKLQEISEPYALANYVLAATAMGDSVRTKWAVDTLRKSALDESGGLYWAMDTNTPFYGWGLAGRIETTALVIKALGLTTGSTENTGKKNGDEKAMLAKQTISPALNSSPVPSVSPVVQNNQQISKGVFWLLKNKDRYGVWLSTQATINVLDAFISLNDAAKTNAEHAAEIFVNGKRVSSVTMPPSNQLVNPLVVNLSQFLSAGKNQIEIKRPSNTALASAQAVAAYYVPWSSSLATPAENFKAGAKRALRLAVTFDKTTAKIGEEISCHVEAERVGNSGYGMLLAEIGLPPGVDVDRASLEKAAQEAGYAINHYEVLPDRIVLYLWPQAGGTKFDFKFKSRYGIKAVNTASTLYDYYNPEARAVIVPEKFIVN